MGVVLAKNDASFKKMLFVPKTTSSGVNKSNKQVKEDSKIPYIYLGSRPKKSIKEEAYVVL